MSEGQEMTTDAGGSGSLRWLGVVCLVVFLSMGRVGAQDFGVSTRKLVLPEVGVVTNWVIRVGGEGYSFMPPLGWRRDHAVRGGVGWVSERGVRLVLERAPEAWLSLAGTNAVNCEAAIARDFPEARMVGRSRCYTEGGEGVMVDLEWEGVQGESMISRVSVVDFSGVGFRFILTARRTLFGGAVSAYQGVLTSFQPVRLEAVGG